MYGLIIQLFRVRTCVQIGVDLDHVLSPVDLVESKPEVEIVHYHSANRWRLSHVYILCRVQFVSMKRTCLKVPLSVSARKCEKT